MEVFILEPVTLKKNFILKNIAFVLILAIGFGTVVMTHGMRTEMTEAKVYFVDAEMMRLIPVKTTIPKANAERMAQKVLDELILGHDDNPKIRRLIPKIENCMSVKVVDEIAYVDFKKEMTDSHPDGRDLELLTVYSIVNSLTGIDGVESVRFTIDGKVQKDFKGHLDMRETFIPDYFI